MPEQGRKRPRRTFRLGSDTRSGLERQEVREELDFHLEAVARELEDEGWNAEDATREARRRFGDVDGTVDYCAGRMARANTRGRWMMWWDDLVQDFRYALRTLFRTPSYSVVVILTLAVGIAANTTIFSLMNPYLLRTLPFANPDELVQVGGVDPDEGWDGGRFSPAQIQELAAASGAFDELGFYNYGTVNLTGGDRAEQRSVARMSGELFGILGTSPVLGRYIEPADAEEGFRDVVVLDQAFFQERFAGDPGLLGRSIDLDGTPHTVIGVMPEDFHFPFGTVDLWVPSPLDPVQTDRASMNVLPIGRLKDGWTPERARADLDGVLAGMAARHPTADGRYTGTSVKPLREALNFAWSIVRVGFGLLLGAVAFVLVIACVNVASLTLARATARARELAIRAAVGAHRSRLVRQLLAESFILAAAGGTLGIVLTYSATGVINGVLPGDLFRVGDVTVDGRVLLFTALLTVVTPILFGLLPALRTARAPLSSTLRTGSGGGGDRGGLRLREGLVVLEVILAMVLVTGTGLMFRSFRQASSMDTGFAPERLALATVTPDARSYDTPEALDGYFASARDAVAALPGVSATGIASHIPLNHETGSVHYASTATGAGSVSDWPTALTSRVDGDYFGAAGIPLLAGSVFQGEAGTGVVISRSLAEQAFRDGSAVGATLRYGSGDTTVEAVVLGVVGDVRYADLTSPVRPHLYRPVEGSTARRRFLVVRTDGSPSSLLGPMRSALAAVDPNVPAALRAYDGVVRENTLLWSAGSFFLGIFGVVALLLAALGIYGLMAYSVSQRQREMGLRIALGAEGSQLQRSVVVSGLRLTGIGVVLGLALAAGLGTLARTVLFGVSAVDPVSLGAATLLFLAVTAAASFAPARRAARVDPIRVLKSD